MCYQQYCPHFSLMAAFAENVLPIMPPISSTAAFADYVLPVLSLFLNDGGICKCQSGGSAASTSKGAKTYILAKYFRFFLFSCIFLISWDFYRDYTWGLVKTVILQESEVLRSFYINNKIFLFSWTSSGIFLSVFVREYCAHQNASLMPSFCVLCVQCTPCTGRVRMFVLSGIVGNVHIP